MSLSNEDYKDIKSKLGTSTAKKISTVTNDARTKAIHAKMKKSDHTPAGRSQKYYRESKGIMESSGSAWPKPRGAKHAAMKKHHDDLMKYETN